MHSHLATSLPRRLFLGSLAVMGLAVLAAAWPETVAAAATAPLNYKFDGSISREV